MGSLEVDAVNKWALWEITALGKEKQGNMIRKEDGKKEKRE